MLVADVMTTDVVTVPVDRTLQDAVGELLDRGVGSVVVERGGDPTGIVTKSDVVEAAHRTGTPLSAIPVEVAMSHPLVRISSDATVRSAVDRMEEAGVKHLAVIEGIDLVGVVTQSDVVRNHSHLLREVMQREERRRRLEDGDRKP